MNSDARTEEDMKEPRKGGWLKIFAMLFGAMMVVVYLGMSYLLLCTPRFAQLISYDWIRYMMGAVFFVYGISRGYRTYKSFINR